MTGGAGTPGALPFLALAERGFKGGVYGQHGADQPRLHARRRRGGDGALMPTGPVIVAEQLPAKLPDARRSRSTSAPRSRRSTARRRPTPSRPIRSTAGWCSLDAAARAIARGEPGTPEFRLALRDAIVQHQGSGRHARRLQLQGRQPLRRRRARRVIVQARRTGPGSTRRDAALSLRSAQQRKSGEVVDMDA